MRPQTMTHQKDNYLKNKIMNNITRIPRPLGATKLGHTLYQDYDKKNKGRLRNHLLTHFIQGTLFWPKLQDTHLRVEDKEAMEEQKAQSKKNKKQNIKSKKKLPTIYKELSIINIEQISIERLAWALGLSVNRIKKKIDRLHEKSAAGMLEEESERRLQLFARATQFGLLNRALDMASKTGQWASELQGVARLKAYAPGLVMGANTAMAQELQIMAAAGKMLETYTGHQGSKPGLQVNIQNNNGTGPNTIEGQLLTPTMAQKMLADQGLTKVPLDHDYLATIHGIHGTELPDIQAVPSDAQGGANFKVEDLLMEPKESRHEVRRVEDEYEASEEVL
jgi:hypothetical protein